MISTSDNIIEFKKKFLTYLEERIPEYRMPASKFYTSFNASLKAFAKKHGSNISSILEIRDISLLTEWQGKFGQNENAVFNARRRESKAQEGLRYYIDFLNGRKKSSISIDATNVASESSMHPDDDTIEKTTEGLRKEVTFFRRSRNRAIRNECAKKYDYTCCVCGMNFEKVYGQRGHEFIEIHHVNPLFTFEEEHDVHIEDLRALCSNCHSMVHHGKTFLSVEKLKDLYEQNRDNRKLY